MDQLNHVIEEAERLSDENLEAAYRMGAGKPLLLSGG